jgi:hypothetical protein
MKNRTLAGLFCATALAAGTLALAQNRPGVEIFEGPSRPMSHDATAISRILVNKQVASCVEEFGNNNVVITDVSAKAFTPTRSQYRISGVVLNGTVKTADALMVITETENSGPGTGLSHKQYACGVRITPVPGLP